MLEQLPGDVPVKPRVVDRIVTGSAVGDHAGVSRGIGRVVRRSLVAGRALHCRGPDSCSRLSGGMAGHARIHLLGLWQVSPGKRMPACGPLGVGVGTELSTYCMARADGWSLHRFIKWSLRL
jgi:hypothetical protein